MNRMTIFAAVAAATVAFPLLLAAQDGRGTVAEPTLPAVCTVLTAQQAVVSGEPSGETLTNTAPDTSRIQTALSACTSGQAVELSASGSNNAFLMGPIYIPNGITLLVDGGVTVFGSRNPADYQVSGAETCGTVGTAGNGCYPLITVGESRLGGSSSSTNSNLMGYGVINGRGADPLIVNGAVATYSWWDQAGTARSGGAQNNPILVSMYKTNSASMYKITLLNSPMFHVKNNYSSNWTAWGVKVLAPWTARNSDGIDPGGNTNVTITNSVIGDGDDEIAISGSSAATGYSFTNLELTSGHGVSIGSYTQGGVSNVLANGLYFSGQAADSNQEGLHIKTAKDRGGLVQNITYENVCLQNVYQPIQLDPLYNTNSGTSYPNFSNITYANVHVLSTSLTPHIEIAGYSATYPATVTFDNVVFDKAPSFSPAWQYAAISFSNAISGTPVPEVYPASLTTNAGTGVTYTNAGAETVSNAYAFNCTGKFPALVGELYATAGGTTYPNTLSVANPATITLNAVVEPTNSEQTYYDKSVGKTYTGVPVPTGTVTFYEGAQSVGTGTLGANGTLASATITNPSVGTHTYTAAIASDSNYSALTFGSLTVVVSAGPATQLAFTTPPPSMVQYGVAPGTVTVAAEDTSGSQTTSTASVTLTVTNNSTSAMQTYTANAVNGVATFALTSSLPGVGTYTYTASSSGLTSASVNESVTPATLTVTAQPASRLYGDPNPAIGYAITGYVNNDPSSVVTGAPSITSPAVRTSPAGTYQTVVSQGTLAAANYNFTLIGSTLQVNGGAPQTISFARLPNFPVGTYQLTARTSSGLAVMYSVTGPAQVSGASLTVQGAGPVTVTASSPANSDYAAATPVSQSFTAQ